MAGEESDWFVSNTPSKVREVLLQNKVTAVLVLISSVFLIYGIYSTAADGDSKLKESEIEIIQEDTPQTVDDTIIIEISGEVKKPGVYELVSGQRVEDALAQANGFTKDANVDWIEKNLNRAATLVDGQKIYIPAFDEHSTASTATDQSVYQSDTSAVLSDISQKVNINSASQSELEALWGIGPVTAKNIIEQRPYSDINELLEKAILKSNVYERNKDILSVY